MKRLYRWSLNLVTAISLLICIGTVALWVESRRASDSLTYSARWNIRPPNISGVIQKGFWQLDRISIQSCGSKIYLVAYEGRRETDGNELPTALPPDREPRLFYSHGIRPDGFLSWIYPRTVQQLIFEIPAQVVVDGIPDSRGMCAVAKYYGVYDSLLVLITAILPAAYAIKTLIRPRRKRNPHACLHCGYDLRATPERCPECGTVRAD